MLLLLSIGFNNLSSLKFIIGLVSSNSDIDTDADPPIFEVIGEVLDSFATLLDVQPICSQFLSYTGM